MFGSDRKDCEDICKKILGNEVWPRIVKLEECLFEKVNPSDGKPAMEEVIGKIVKEVLLESGIEREIIGLKEKQKGLQTTEQNLKDTEKELAEKKEELQQLKERFHEKEKENSCLKDSLKENEEKLNSKDLDNSNLQETLNETIKKATKDLDELREKLESEKDSLNTDWKKQKDSWEGEDLKKKEKIQKLESLLEEAQKQYQILREKKNNYKSNLESRTSELNKLQVLYKESCDKNQSLSNEKEQLIQENHEMTEKLEKVRFSLEEEEMKVKSYSDKFGVWDEATKKYKKLLGALLACDSLSGMLECYEIKKEKGVEDVNNILCTISMFGSESDMFLKNLHSFLESDRKENKRYLCSEECYLFECLNQYYKEEDGIEEDLIRYPNAGDKFDKSMMVDMEYRNKIYRTVEGVYVPTIMRDEKNPLLLALVKGV